MIRRSLALPLATILSLIALLTRVQFVEASSVEASSVVWNTTIQGAAGICDSPCVDNSVAYGFNTPNITVQYRAYVVDQTGNIIPPGGSVPVGTKLSLNFDKHVSEDIYWFATGAYLDSPYGDWGEPYNTIPPIKCITKDLVASTQDISDPYITENSYTPFVVRPPEKTISGSNHLLSCGSLLGDVQQCTAIAQGTVPLSFDFGSTVGEFYAQYTTTYTGGGTTACSGIGTYPMTIKTGGYWYRTSFSGNNWWTQFVKEPGAITNDVNIPTQSVPYPINIVPAMGGPTKPSVSAGTCITGTAFTISFSSTDPNSYSLRYGVDWDDDGSVDQWVPPSGFVPSGTSQNASRTYTITGQKTVRVLAQNDQGISSDWTTQTFDCTEAASCPVGYVLQNGACIFSACPSGYTLQGTQCVAASGECTAPNYCKDSSLMDGCTGDVLQACAWGCTGSTCNAVPAPVATLTAVPSLVHQGDATQVSWTSNNVTGCTVTSTRDSWTGLSGTETSHPITSQTTFTLRCNGYAGATPGTITKTAVVNIAPVYQEK